MSSEIHVAFRAELEALIALEQDSLRICPLGAKACDKVIHIGQGTVIDADASLIL